MFVPHEPNNCFDVHRTDDRCVCGCSAISTNHQGNDNGYCPKCSEKRKMFVESVVGEIFIGDCNSVSHKILIVIEELRKVIFSERLYYMVDQFFNDYQNDITFVEPYKDDIFNAKVYSTTMKVVPSIPEKVLYSKKNIEKYISQAYKYYSEQLSLMIDFCVDEFCDLNSKIGGYKYTRKFIKTK